jgi:C1A family cysteine protease
MIFTVLISLALATPHILTWSDYKEEFGKKYSSRLVHDQRQKAFQANVELIKKHNSEDHSYKLGVNQFADLTQEEFAKRYLSPFKRTRASRVKWLNITAPSSVDWRQHNAVTPVKNQGNCGSCWSFSTTGSVEGAAAIASGKLISLSEQQLVDCGTPEGNHGCNGGLMDFGFQYIEDNQGITTEDDYPYTARDGTCQATKASHHVVTVTGYSDVPSDNPSQFEMAVSKGPVSIAIEADKSAFQLYKSGVMDNTACGTQLDHGVLVVGYGYDSTESKDYWIVKNSWGATWGEQGYIRLGKSNSGDGMCGMYKQPSYPAAGGSGPTPPPGPTPTPSTGPYEDPANGCASDEMAIQIQGVSGAFCAPSCSTLKPCPSPPSGMNGEAECALQTSTGEKYCAVICNPYGANQCEAAAGMTCKSIQGTGICTYDESSFISTMLMAN